jgi:hypothetical protein
MAGQSLTGKSVSAGDQVTILGIATAISGTGPNALVTVSPQNGGSSFVAKASDMYAPQSSGPALSKSGKPFDVGAPARVRQQLSQ